MRLTENRRVSIKRIKYIQWILREKKKRGLMVTKNTDYGLRDKNGSYKDYAVTVGRQTI